MKKLSRLWQNYRGFDKNLLHIQDARQFISSVRQYRGLAGKVNYLEFLMNLKIISINGTTCMVKQKIFMIYREETS